MAIVILSASVKRLSVSRVPAFFVGGSVINGRTPSIFTLTRTTIYCNNTMSNVNIFRMSLSAKSSSFSHIYIYRTPLCMITLMGQFPQDVNLP